jgi:hypothetical protein
VAGLIENSARIIEAGQALRPLCCAVACTGCQGFEGANARGYFGEAT